MRCCSSIVAITAAAPAVYAKQRPDERLSKALGEFVVVPMTWRRARLASPRFIGERVGVCLRKGDDVGVNLMAPLSAGLTILVLEGVTVCDIASSACMVKEDGDGC